MSNVLVIKPITAKEQMNSHLNNLAIGENLLINKSDQGKWAVHISNHVHPISSMRFSISTDESIAPKGMANIERIK